MTVRIQPVVFAFCLIFFISTQIALGRASSGPDEILDMIDRVCGEGDAKGERLDIKIIGTGEARVMKILRLLADGSVGGEMTISKSSVEGVLSEVNRLKEQEARRACRMRYLDQVFDKLVDIKLGSSSPRNSSKDKPDNDIRDNDDCRILGSRIEIPIEIKNGSCFLSENRGHRSYVKLISHNGIIYSNFRGKEITCLLGDTCSFGWPNSPKFNISFSGHPDGITYIFNAD